MNKAQFRQLNRIHKSEVCNAGSVSIFNGYTGRLWLSLKPRI